MIEGEYLCSRCHQMHSLHLSHDEAVASPILSSPSAAPQEQVINLVGCVNDLEIFALESVGPNARRRAGIKLMADALRERLAASQGVSAPQDSVIQRAQKLIARVGIPQAYSMEGPANPEGETYSICCDDLASDGKSHRCFGTVVAHTTEQAAQVAQDIGEAFAIVGNVAQMGQGASAPAVAEIEQEMRELAARGEHAHGLTVIQWADRLAALRGEQKS